MTGKLNPDALGDLVKALEAIRKEADIANETIRLNRDGKYSGRVRVATAMHRVARMATAALAKAREL